MNAVPELERLGFELIPELPGTIRVRWPRGPEPDEAPPLIEELRQNKVAALEELAAWDEQRARMRQRHAFDWADQVTPCGCWVWVLENDQERLQNDLEVTFDQIDHAFMDRDVEGLSLALSRFRRVVQQAVQAYQLGNVQTPNSNTASCFGDSIPES